MRAWKFVLLLGAVAAAGLATRRKKRGVAARRATDSGFDLVDQAGIESFPASDPPSWTLGEERER